VPTGWRRVELSQSPRERALQRLNEREFWEQITDLSWGSVYSPKDVERAYWRDIEMGSQENRFYDWRTAKTFQPSGAKGQWYTNFALRISGVKGPRSRLRSRCLFAWLNAEKPKKRSPVWVRVDEESEQELADPAERMQYLVKRKIALVQAMEAPCFTEYSSWWTRAEEAADLFVQ